jgi:hypothetical protein
MQQVLRQEGDEGKKGGAPRCNVSTDEGLQGVNEQLAHLQKERAREGRCWPRSKEVVAYTDQYWRHVVGIIGELADAQCQGRGRTHEG